MPCLPTSLHLYEEIVKHCLCEMEAPNSSHPHRTELSGGRQGKYLEGEVGPEERGQVVLAGEIIAD